MSGKTKLELTWIGKDQEPILEPRILLEDPELSYRADFRVSENDIFDNRLIFGDNLLALKALEQEFSGKIKCIYIDPPYNTGSAFSHYDDGVEHSIWLSLMRDRLEILKRLLTDDGSLWISIDENEVHYLKVLCDEIFGRKNFIDSIIWQKLYTVKNSARFFSDMHEYILVYTKNSEQWKRNLLPRSSELNESYLNPDNDPRGPWTTNAIQARNYYSQGTYEITSPGGKIFTPPSGTYWRISKENFDKHQKDGRIWWGKNGDAVPRIKKFLNEAKQGVVPATIWFHQDVATNAEAKVEIRKLFADVESADIFMTPKPEKLIQRVVQIATNPGDIVLDSFAGSGTTGAVAHKMGRKWIMIELGDHCHTHIIPRLKKVIDVTDEGGISKVVNWQGGGGFRYYRLAPSLLVKDKFGNWVISKEYNPEMLSEGMCKLKGFIYEPDEAVYWKQGKSTELDYIFTTTQLVTRELADQIMTQLEEDEHLLICCKAYNLNPQDYPQITFEKIPLTVLKRCEFGRDDYSLEINEIPQERIIEQMTLFGVEDEK
jgi:adenine-specific DNA-methyltransferase